MRLPKRLSNLNVPVIAFWVPYLVAVIIGYGCLIARFSH